MGQELLILSLDWKQKGKEGPQCGFQRTCEQIDKRIDKLKELPGPNDIDEVSGGAWYYASSGMPVDEDSGSEVTLDAYKQHLHGLVGDLRDSWEGRDTVCFKVGGDCGHWVFITGGNSWGDCPSETYDVLSKLYSAGVV